MAENQDVVKSKNVFDSLNVVNKDVVDKQNVMEKMMKEDIKNTKEINEICRYLTTKLPAGCQLIECHINIDYSDGLSRTHGVRMRKEISEHYIQDSLKTGFMLKVVIEVQKIS